MTVARIACLTGLVLAANTLPANEWPAAEDERTREQDSHPAPTAPDEPTGEEEEEPSSPALAPLEVDVWDGNAARNPCPGSHPPVVVSLPGYDPGLLSALADPDPFARAEAPTRRERSPRRWLTCRYAHAPPAGV